MTRINLFPLNSVAWGKSNHAKANSTKNNFDQTSTLIFAALLIACSMTVGCSSDKPKSISSISPSPITQPTPPVTASSVPAATPVEHAAVKHVHKKIVRKVPPTVTYVDSVSGVTFQYPRKYALKTGDAAEELLSSDPIAMDFVQPGGVALAAVALPDSTYPNSDLASAVFNVSVNKTLTANQCGEFSVPQPNPAAPADPRVQATAQLATAPLSKLMIGDMELDSAETNVTSETSETTNNPGQESSKYYHVFQNGACYEFALKVATTKLDTATTTKPSPSRIDRDEVFHRLEAILATVKINPVATPEVKAEAKTNASPETPAQ
ncbi:MAG: hypothetical protein WBQ03_18725 [Candidatus Sulfotelmatobacter sp.]